MALRDLAIPGPARAYVPRALFALLLWFQYVVRTYVVHFLRAGGWSGLGSPGGSTTAGPIVESFLREAG